MSILFDAILVLTPLPVLLVLFVLFRVARQYVRQASLHAIPGPPPDSLFTGTWLVFSSPTGVTELKLEWFDDR